MATPNEDEKYAKVVHKIDPHSRLLRAWELHGGISAQVTGLEIEQPDGQRIKMIVRRHGEVDFKHNPRIAADEFKLLQLLHSAGIAAPRPYYLDESGEIFSTPYIVIEYIEGKTEFAPVDVSNFMLQFTLHLTRIHQVDCSRLDVAFLPQQARRFGEKLRVRPERLDASVDEGRMWDALEAVWPIPQRNRSVLLHGDYWPGNLLWRDGRLVAIIDWEDAALGDPLADVANSRLELLWALGIEAMQGFTRQYQALTGVDFSYLPCWDLCAALRSAAQFAEWAVDDEAEKSMQERFRWFITQAFEKL